MKSLLDLPSDGPSIALHPIRAFPRRSCGAQLVRAALLRKHEALWHAWHGWEGLRSQWAQGMPALPACLLLVASRSRRHLPQACRCRRGGGGQMIPVAACMAWHATICGSLAMLPALPFTATATPGGNAGRAAPSSRLMQGTAADAYLSLPVAITRHGCSRSPQRGVTE